MQAKSKSTLGEASALRSPFKGLVAEFEADDCYSSHYDPECAGAIAEFNTCDCCHKSGLTYRGFKGRGEFVAISVCPHCGNEQAF